MRFYVTHTLVSPLSTQRELGRITLTGWRPITKVLEEEEEEEEE